MRSLIFLISFLLATPAALAQQEKHLLYMTTPDAAQPGGSGEGLMLFDIEDGHRFVRRIDVPSFKEGVRGISACAATGRLYVTTSTHRLICMDLKTDAVLWEHKYDTGCDRAAITPDGKTLYVPSGWWIHDNCWLVVSGETGDEIAPRIKVNGASHNTLASLDGSRAYLASTTTLDVVDTKTHQIIQSISPIGESGVFPFTVNGAQTRAYVCLGQTVGFDIADLTTGKVLTRVLPDGPPMRRRTHGAGLTPDEKELWISDQAGNAVYVFDNTLFPPKQSAKIDISKGGHGWVAFSLDGRFAYTASTEVIDTKTHKPITTFKDETGKPVCSSKFVEVQFNKDGAVTRVGDQFGVGRVTK
jgi:DNA-binding beta-propeller fold protein YncE